MAKPRTQALPGAVYGKLTVVSEAARTPRDERKRDRRVVARCACGQTHDYAVSDLRKGAVQSCGCDGTPTPGSRVAALCAANGVAHRLYLRRRREGWGETEAATTAVGQRRPRRRRPSRLEPLVPGRKRAFSPAVAKRFYVARKSLPRGPA